MPKKFTMAMAVFTMLLGLACAGAALAEPPGKPVGTVKMEFGQGGFIVGATGGKGTLVYGGRKYSFRVGGLGVGTVGLAKVNATGKVYNLKRIEDFAGGYFQAKAGITVVEGPGVQWLENSNGVIMELRSTGKGLSLTVGAEGVVIEMGAAKKKKSAK